MHENAYMTLLETLAPIGLTGRYDLSIFFLPLFPRPTTSDIAELQRQASEVNVFLHELKNRGHIKIHNDYAHIGFYNDKLNWLGDMKILASITSLGFEHLYQQDLIKSNLAVNEASKRNAKTQLRLTIITIVVAAIGAVSALAAFLVNTPQLKSVTQRIDTLEKRQNTQDIKLKGLQSFRSSQKDSSRRVQPFSSNSVQTTSAEKSYSKKR